MATLGHHPPAADNQAALGSMPGVRFTEGVVFAVDGPAPVGPEAAGAVLVLQSVLDRDDKAQQFWSRAAVTLRAARERAGFIRFIAFGDGLCNYAIGFWRSPDDAMAFFRSPSHAAAMHELDASGNQYGHFAGLFKTDRLHERHVYCEECGSGNALIDVFKIQSATTPGTAS
jgi:hypothetical protein